MAKHTLPNLGLTGGYPDGADEWGPEVNASLLKVSTLLQGSVIGRIAAVPANPAQGDAYVLTAAPNAQAVAVYDEAAWTYYQPGEGWFLYDRGTDNYISYDGAVWKDFVASGGGTTPDPGNGGGGGTGRKAYRYWRIAMPSGVGQFYAYTLSELQWRAVKGGPSIATGGTPIGTPVSEGNLGQAYDGDNSTSPTWIFGSNQRVAPQEYYLGYDFAKEVVIEEFFIKARAGTDGSSRQIPFAGRVEASSDGIIWQTVWLYAFAEPDAGVSAPQFVVSRPPSEGGGSGGGGGGATSGGDLVNGWRMSSDGYLEQWGEAVNNQDVVFTKPFTEGVSSWFYSQTTIGDLGAAFYAGYPIGLTKTGFKMRGIYTDGNNYVTGGGEKHRWRAFGK